MGRLTDNDFHFGPITYGRSGWSACRLVWSSGGGEDEEPRNTLLVAAFRWVARVPLPRILRPWRVRHSAKHWDAETIRRLGRDWYDEVFPREYGFCVSDGHLSIFYGPRTDDSSTEKRWGWFLPWTQWRFICRRFYGLHGEHLDTAPARTPWDVESAMKANCPAATFVCEDYDGARVEATTRIEEREWWFGTGWFRWLRFFRRPKVQRTLDIEFGAEVGKDKGSWKGGLIGCGIEMLPGELHEGAFRRYCAQVHRSKCGPYTVKYVGQI